MNYLEYNFESFLGTMSENEYISMINILEKFKPKRICELGSGQSTNIFEIYCDKYNAKLFSIEHDENYIKPSTILLPLIDKETSININNHIYNSCNKYDNLEKWLKTQDKFDFILIDGPFGWGERELYKYSRIQILSFVLLDKISDNAYILYHDSERNNAKTTLNEFERLLNIYKYEFNKKIINENEYPELTIYKINKIKE